MPSARRRVRTVEPMATRFRDATAVERRSDGSYAAEIREGWDIGGNANGGYLLALAARAMADAVGRPPLTITCHYLRPAPAGTCTVDVDVVRSGRRLATVSATLVQDGQRVVTLLGTFGDQQPGGPGVVTVAPFAIAPFDECTRRPPTAEAPAIMANLNCRIHPGDARFAEGEPSGRPEMRGWFDLADGEPIDAFGLLLATDCFPPAIFNTEVSVAWVPTVELTVHVRGTPEPGPLRCRFVSRSIRDGVLEEDGEVWDAADTLVAQSRQLALMPRPA